MLKLRTNVKCEKWVRIPLGSQFVFRRESVASLAERALSIRRVDNSTIDEHTKLWHPNPKIEII
jgi:hypothetical protein